MPDYRFYSSSCQKHTAHTEYFHMLTCHTLPFLAYLLRLCNTGSQLWLQIKTAQVAFFLIVLRYAQQNLP